MGQSRLATGGVIANWQFQPSNLPFRGRMGPV